MAASEVSIANRALQKLGEGRIESFDEDSPNARSIVTAYEPVRDRLQRQYDWNFCIGRASIAADATKTKWGDLNRYQKPNDFQRLLRNKETSAEDIRHDWQIEGNFIVTSDGAPLQFRYIKKVTDPALFDPLFSELLSTVLAMEICLEVTGSNTRKVELKDDITTIIREARIANALENDADVPLEDDWLLARE